MDISTVICTETNDKTFNELLPEYHTNGKVNDELLALFERINKTDDVLQAIKMDPAVLEAQITVDYKETKNVDTAFNRDSRSGVRNDVLLENEPRGSFDNIMESHQEALRSLTRYQYDFLLELADTLRKQRLSVQRNFECAFCKNNGQPLSWYSSHALKDWRGRVLCPVLRSYRCFICGATGNRAHTIKYCPRRIY